VSKTNDIAEAARLLEAGRLDAAESLVRRLLAKSPADIHAIRLMAAIGERKGDLSAAAKAVRRGLAATPSEPMLLLMDGMLCQHSGRLVEAEKSLAKAIRLAPGLLDARLCLGIVLGQMNRHAEAAELLLTLAAECPGAPLVRHNAGIAAFKAGRHAEAAPHLAEARRHAPDDAELAILEARNHIRLGQAPLARAGLSALVSRHPDHREMRLVLAEACAKCSAEDEAIAQWMHLLTAEPDSAELLSLVGQAHLEMGNYAVGLDFVQRSLRAAPTAEGRVLAATALPTISRDHEEITSARARFLAETTALAETIGPVEGHPVAGIGTFLLAYHGADSRPHRRAYARLMEAANPAFRITAPHCQGWTRPKNRRPRVGFVSFFFYDHTIADIFAGYMGLLDKTRFETVALFLPGPEDRVRAGLRTLAERAIDLPDEPLAAQQAIAGCELDVLIFLDIGMQPIWDLLAYGRLAPVQAALFGHPETTGIDTLDYFLSCDAMEPVNGEEHYWEKLVRLPGPVLMFPEAPAAAPKPRADLGLPEDGRLYVCPQSLFKLHPDFDRALAGILRADPGGRVVLLKSPSDAAAALYLERLGRAAPDIVGRVHMLAHLPKPDFPRMLAACDVMLDPFHYSGGHTTFTAFSVGLPVVTWAGEFMRGRHTHGFYTLMGINDAIASDQEDYVRRAVDIACDADRRRRLSQAIAEAAPALFADRSSLRGLEDFIEQAVGLRP
jgi:predicted O-linked N-acetylglucosamine transferase (SPINDLY family)